MEQWSIVRLLAVKGLKLQEIEMDLIGVHGDEAL
jgi:hypothetical protein